MQLPFNEQKILSLSELSELISETLEFLPPSLWVVAEIARLNVNMKSGHCYLELVEKKEEKVVAQVKGIIWADNFFSIRKNFLQQAGTELQSGMKILMLGHVNYHQVYGLSLNVLDVDIRYTLGEMALKRRETLERLTREGIIDRNKSLDFPLVPQRLAVISSETAAGYGDFLAHLLKNPYGYSFQISLFPAFMQGQQAEDSLSQALSLVEEKAEDFDAVVLIRGGGSQVDLHVFDSYQLARKVAFFPLPVLTGIGHERDQPVLNYVAWQSFITPTAVANFLLEKIKTFENTIEETRKNLRELIRSFLQDKSSQLYLLMQNLQTGIISGLQSPGKLLTAMQIRVEQVIRSLIMSHSHLLDLQKERVKKLPLNLINTWQENLKHDYQKLKILDPTNILKRGYSITCYKGHPLKNVQNISVNDLVFTMLYEGCFQARVTEVKEKKEENLLPLKDEESH